MKNDICLTACVIRFLNDRDNETGLKRDGLPAKRTEHLVGKEGFIFVRKSNHYHPNKGWFETFDIANISIKEPGRGYFTGLLKMVETAYPEVTIFVESIIEPRFIKFFESRGYEITGLPGCYNAWRFGYGV